jgi:hypothetical protein
MLNPHHTVVPRTQRLCNLVCRRSCRCGSRMRGPNGDATSCDRTPASSKLAQGPPTAPPPGDPHPWAQPPSSSETAIACLPPTTYTITTITPRQHRPSASATCTSHPDHRTTRAIEFLLIVPPEHSNVHTDHSLTLETQVHTKARCDYDTYVQRLKSNSYHRKRPKGLLDVEDPILYRQSAHRWRQVVGLTYRPRSTTQKHYFCASGTLFCYKPSKLTA